MKKIFLTICFVINLVFLIFTQYSIAIDNSSNSNDSEWHEVQRGWFTGGTWYNGSIYNKSVVPIYPALEGDGIIRRNMTFIELNVPNYAIFSIRFISIPKIERIWSGDYFVQEERIIAVYFTIENQSVNSNYSEMLLTLFDPSGNEIFIQKLENENNITEFHTPVILNSSGLYNIRIEFTNGNDLWVFENVERWLEKNENEKYLTFGFENTTNMSFQNYYERAIPVFSVNEIIGLQQMFLAEQQAKYLSDTANSLEDIANESITNTIFTGVVVAIVTVFLTLLGSWRYDIYKERNLTRAQWTGLRGEIESNITKLNENIDALQHLNTPILFFDMESYHAMLNTGKINSLPTETRNNLRRAYIYMEYYDYYEGLYNAKGEQIYQFPQDIVDMLRLVLDHLPN